MTLPLTSHRRPLLYSGDGDRRRARRARRRARRRRQTLTLTLTLALTLSLTFIGPRAGTEAPPPCSFSPRKAAAKRLSAASVGALVCGKASWRPSLVFGFGFRFGLVVRAVLGVEA